MVALVQDITVMLVSAMMAVALAYVGVLHLVKNVSKDEPGRALRAGEIAHPR